ncbi:MAG: helix-turn-helix domain-containing protein [Oscillospiraceae bacterium]|jgi:transcriptional regulator with XRE-family HTH domain|nr:helix-turn-helix domain-containing protein [Oscillospiraceae bacterium]
MDGAQLGKKLKEARLAKKMTQSDVVGTFITRNMLSQIESGAAFPSIRTLEYLAKTLEIPMHYLIPDENAEVAAHEPEASGAVGDDLFVKCKSAYLRGEYAFVTERAADLSDKGRFFYDEGVALLARAYLNMAKILSESNKPKSAVSCARYAADYGAEGIYASREVRTKALLTLDELSEKLKP